MADRIMSLCPACRKLIDGPYRVKGIIEKTTTEIKGRCDYCGRRVDKSLVKQVLVCKK